MIKENVKLHSEEKLKPFIAPDSTEQITAEDIEKRIRRIRRADEIGLSLTRADIQAEHENPYRAEAMGYIIRDKEVPEKLKEQIRQYDEQYQKISTK